MINTNIDLMQCLNDKVILLDTALRELSRRGQIYAQAEHDYRVSLAEKILIEKSNGMSVTLISDICRGDKKIAKLKFERDCAEVVYKSALEAINAIKLQIKVIDNTIQREWTS